MSYLKVINQKEAMLLNGGEVVHPSVLIAPILQTPLGDLLANVICNPLLIAGGEHEFCKD